MRYILMLLFFLTISDNLLIAIGKYPIQNFTPAEYKAGNQNIDFVQNRDMNLFVANNLSVLSYNGNEWERHAFRTGEKKRSLAFDDENNRLYVGRQGDFGFFEDDWSYISLLDKIPNGLEDFDEVWDVFIIDSLIYFCTFQGIYKYDGHDISVINHPDGLNRSFTVNNKLFTQTSSGKLLEVKEDKLIPAVFRNQKNQIISGIVPNEEGYLIFYNSGEIEHSTPYVSVDRFRSLIQALQGTYVNHVLQLSDTRLAISTQTAGLFLYDFTNNTIERITTQEGLQTNACLRSFQDYSGNLWLGLQNGIALIHINSPLRLINQESNIQGSGYEAFQSEEGSYYTTSNGIYFLQKGESRSIFLKGTEGPSYGIHRIAGKIYAGHHTGLFLLDQTSAQKVVTTDGLWQIKRLKSNPEIAIAGTYAGLYLFKINDSNNLIPITEIEGFRESSRFFEEDINGNILVGQYYKGLYKVVFEDGYKKVNVSHLENPNNFPIDEQIILSRLDNDLFVATNKGLYKIDQNNYSVTKAELLSDVIGDQPVYLIAQDKQKNIHVVANNLVGFFKKISASNYEFVPSSLFQLRYYFNNDLLNISINIADGIMFSSNEGFLYYNPELESRSVGNNALVVRQIESIPEDLILYQRQPFGVMTALDAEIDVPKGTSVLKFEVETFQFNEIKNKQFRYRLVGFESEYGEWTNSAIKEYSNLSDGTYQFLVQNRNYLGQISTSKPLSLVVHPPFYKSTLAKILFVLLGGLSLYLASRHQKGRYKKKASELNKLNQLELDQKQAELKRIEREKEAELQQMKDDKMQSELKHINNLLAASTMNLVVKNEFIVNIKEKLKEVNRKGKNEVTKQALEQIVKEIDFKLRLQEDWEQFQHHFDQVHGDFLSRLRTEFHDLSPNEQKLSALLRLNLNTKEIANLMSISLRGVEVARYRLRKKLNLPKGKNLSMFILEY